MPSLETIRRAFISYSRQDSEFVNVLAQDLRNNGIDLWIDFEGLTPGTPDWEAAVREAIAESFAVLLIATPNSRKSSYVRSELLLAESKGLPMYALWSGGENWIDSVPMSLAHIQYQDFRGEAYASSLPILIDELSRQGGAIPDHFLYRSYYTKVLPGGQQPELGEWFGSVSSSNSSFKVFRKKSLNDFMEIQIVDPFEGLRHRDSVDALFVKPSEFKMAIHLLDAIYLNYLTELYPPLSYVNKWILCSKKSGASLLAIDWRWLQEEKVYPPKPSTVGMLEPPEYYGMVAGSRWEIKETLPPDMIVLAVNDEWIVDSIIQHPKAAYEIMGEYMQVCDTGSFDGTQFKKVAVISDLFFGPGGFANKLLIQIKDYPDELKKRYQY